LHCDQLELLLCAKTLGEAKIPTKNTTITVSVLLNIVIYISLRAVNINIRTVFLAPLHVVKKSDDYSILTGFVNKQRLFSLKRSSTPALHTAPPQG
jgi:hypothetical protein